MKDISVTYLGGSGFLAWYGDTGFLFDASKNGPDERILPEPETLNAFRRLFVFISHHHLNNFDPDIYSIVPEHAVFFLGYDIPDEYEGIRLNPGEESYLDGLTVKAFDSTDAGVSFLITLDGITLFHAGNLNLWHWREESSVTEIEAAEQDFYDCIEPIISEKPQIDVAFFPVDPRQGSMYDAGAGYFLMNLKPRVMIPMHFQGRGDVAMRFAVTNENDDTKVIVLQKAGETVTFSIPESENQAPDQKLLDFLRDNPIEPDESPDGEAASRSETFPVSDDDKDKDETLGGENAPMPDADESGSSENASLIMPDSGNGEDTAGIMDSTPENGSAPEQGDDAAKDAGMDQFSESENGPDDALPEPDSEWL